METNPEPQEISPQDCIGSRLRLLRLNQCHSLKTLAKLSGLSINTLSLIENNKTSPSVSTLMQLASALNVPITAFFASEPTPKKIVYTSRFNRGDSSVASARLENLGKGLAGNAVQPFVITLERGAGSGERMVVHSGHEFVFILSGRLLYLIEDKPYLLDPNDSLVFESHMPHRWKNIGEGESQILLILYPSDAHEDPGGHHFSTE